MSDSAGIRCPGCSGQHAPVYYTRHRENRTVRKRICANCGKRFITTEYLAGDGPKQQAADLYK